MDVRLPDGTVIRGVPDGMSKVQLIAKLKKNGYDTTELRKVAVAEQEAADRALYDPTKGMSGVEKFVAGYGKAIPDMVRGVGQTVGLVDQETVDEAKRRDAPLMASGAGMAGNIGGNIAAALPAAFVPGAATIPGAAVVGGVMGAAQPVATGESRALNAGMGVAAGGGGVLAGRTLAAGYHGAKALAEPFTSRGRDQIAGRMIARFADDPASIAAANSRPTITGARPTLAEQTGDAGLARLQDSLRAADPQFNNAISGRLSDNNAARVSALRGLTGQDGARDFAVANRAGTAQQLYGDAFSVIPDAAGLTPAQSRTMASLLKSPDVKSAMAEARRIAANKGTNIGPSNGTGSIEGLHNMKMALDDAIAAAKSAGKANKAESIKAAQTRLVGLIEELSPDYKAARVTYAQMSKPINSMDVATDVARRGLSNGSDLAGNPTINRNALLGALKDEPALIRRATGRNVGNALSDVMEPQDLSLLRAIAAEADRAGAVATAGNGPGSATAQRMASQNVLRQIIGPTGLPQSWAENALANTVIGKPLNLIYGGVAEPRIQQTLARAVLDPDAARAVIQAAQRQGIQLPPSTMKLLLAQAGRSAAPAAIPGQR